MSEDTTYKFTWTAGGCERHANVAAPNYAVACWKLGKQMGSEFIRNGVPTDFHLHLPAEHCRLDTCLQEPEAKADL